MIKDFEAVKKQLEELAGVVNAFKSEAVQLRIVELLLQGLDESSSRPRAVQEHGEFTSRRPPRRRRKKVSRTSSDDSERTAKGSKARGSTRPGGMATLTKLVDDGFLKKPQTLKKIVEHCDLNLALKYKQSDFSGPLARFVRDGKLRRTRNADKQYEYSQV
jgi:hypothetical protein